jgi:ribonuclease P protein component
MTTPLSGRQTFRKPERLVSKIAFEQLLKDGKSFHEFPVRVIWKEMPLPTPYPLQVAFSVPKRIFKRAVDRNRVKRLLRESYRKNKVLIQPFLSGKNKQYAVLFVYTGKKLPDYADVQQRMISILQQLATTVR